MTTIFISGSREIPFIPDEVRERVDRIIDSGFDIVVGDSERGVDSAILRYLESRSYENVSVYTIHDKPRVKGVLEAWRICKIAPETETKTDKAGNVRNRRELETAKDRWGKWPTLASSSGRAPTQTALATPLSARAACETCTNCLVSEGPLSYIRLLLVAWMMLLVAMS